MSSSPNFPAGLAIRPSRDPYTSSSEWDNFDAAAQEAAIKTYGIAGRVWYLLSPLSAPSSQIWHREAAYALSAYLSAAPAWQFDPPPPASAPAAVLELGAGTGVIARKLARTLTRAAGNVVIATDLLDVCSFLERNLHGRSSDEDEDDASGEILVRPLAWGNAEHAGAIMQELRGSRHGSIPTAAGPLTHIVCSDLVYFPALLAPLLRTLLDLTHSHNPTTSSAAEDGAQLPDPGPTIIIAYKIRSLAKETPFWQAFGLWFAFYPVLVRRPGDEADAWSTSFSEDDQIFIFLARRRPESSAWSIPASDDALLRGCGARGTQTGKSDDTFETLLLAALSW